MEYNHAKLSYQLNKRNFPNYFFSKIGYINCVKGCLAHAGTIYSYQTTIVTINVVNVTIANITKKHNIVSSLQSKNLISRLHSVAKSCFKQHKQRAIC